MNLIFKKSLTALLFSFVFVLAFFSFGSLNVEAADVPVDVFAKTTTGVYSNPLNLSAPESITFGFIPSSAATSCTLSGPGITTVTKVPATGSFSAGTRVEIGSSVTPPTGSTTYTVTCEFTDTYSWSTGTWGACIAGTPASCTGTYNILTAGGNCSGTPTPSGSCTFTSGNYQTPCKEKTTPSSCASTQQVPGGPYCSWNDTTPQSCVYETVCGTGYLSNMCLATGPALTESSCGYIAGCTWNVATTSTTYQCAGPTTSSACTTQNAACIFTSATSGSQTRTVVCKNSSGVTVTDSFCAAPKPTTSQSCTPAPTAVNGVCNNTVNNGCTAGALSDTADSSTNYLWSCVGSNGGTTSSCSLAIPSSNVEPTQTGDGGNICNVWEIGCISSDQQTQ